MLRFLPTNAPPHFMKTLLTFCSLLFLLPVAGQTSTPEVFAPYLTADVGVKGEVVVVLPPEEIATYVARVEENAAKDPEWFAKYSEEAKPGIPLPFHEKLGLSKEEYNEYLKLWDQRKMEPIPRSELFVRLEKTGKDDEWMIRVTGRGSDITSMRYNAKSDTFTSINGTLNRLEDIKSDKRSILGEWVGREWKLEKEDDFGFTKENLAVGKLADNSYGLIVYRVQEVSPEGIRLFDKSMVIRFLVKQS